MRVRARARKTDLMAEPTDTKYENRPLRWRWFGSPRTVAVLAASILVVGAIIYGVFIAYSVSLGEEFNKMSAEGMNDFTAAQKIESESSISEIRNTVLTIRTLAESPDIDPEGEVFTDFLDSWNERSSFGVTYVSIATLEEGVNDSNRKESDREILRRLKAGESVVSDVRKSNRLDGYFYSIAEPVVKDNMVVGVLRSIVDAHTLIDTTQIKSSVTLLGSVLMKGDGTIIVDSEKSELYDGSNLYDVLRSQGYADAIVNKMQENVENDSDVATLAIGKRNGKTTFFTSVRLNENDWTIVNFTEENTIAEHSQVILHDTVVAGTVLVVISTIACIVVALVIGRFRRRALREADRYAVLAEFSDTVLFEYSYSDDVLELTPNARSVFSLDSLRREHYLERGIPLIDFHEEDVSLVGEILENPRTVGRGAARYRPRTHADRRVPLVLHQVPLPVRRAGALRRGGEDGRHYAAARLGGAAGAAVADRWFDEGAQQGHGRREDSRIACRTRSRPAVHDRRGRLQADQRQQRAPCGRSGARCHRPCAVRRVPLRRSGRARRRGRVRGVRARCRRS